MQLEAIGQQMKSALDELTQEAQLRAGRILVVGCSTSEVLGERIGSFGSTEVARELMAALQEAATASGTWLAIQCCEHLNRALVVERAAVERFHLEEVAVIPMPRAGGAMAAQAMRSFDDPVVVETIRADAGLDIGATLIGMHLKRVAVPVRLKTKCIGQAALTAAKTRPKLIGGSRAIYEV